MSRTSGNPPFVRYAIVVGVTLGWVAALLLQSDDPDVAQVVSN